MTNYPLSFLESFQIRLFSQTRQQTIRQIDLTDEKKFVVYLSIRGRHWLEKLKIVPISIDQEIAGITSSADLPWKTAVPKDFSKWLGAYYPEIARDVRADEAEGMSPEMQSAAG